MFHCILKLLFFCTRHNTETDHIQLSVDGVLSKLRHILPNDALCMIGLTPFDLYGDDTDLFVAGMAAGIPMIPIFIK